MKSIEHSLVKLTYKIDRYFNVAVNVTAEGLDVYIMKVISFQISTEES